MLVTPPASRLLPLALLLLLLGALQDILLCRPSSSSTWPPTTYAHVRRPSLEQLHTQDRDQGQLGGGAGRLLSSTVPPTDEAQSSCWLASNHNASAPYSWFSSVDSRSRALVNVGDRSRLRQALERYRAGQGLLLTLAGGSISAGAGVVDGQSLKGWLLEVLHAHLGPGVKVEASAIPGINTGFISLCHDLHIPRSSDVIVLEYSMNDREPDAVASATHRPLIVMDNAARRPWERLIRKLLNYPNRPALLMLHAYSWDKLAFTPKGTTWSGCFWSTAEAELHEFAMYYSIPELSVKAAAYHLMIKGAVGYQVNRTRSSSRSSSSSADPGNPQAGGKDDAAGKVFYYDTWHPDGLTGARVMAEISAQVVLDTWSDVLMQHSSGEELRGAQDQATALVLPAPMLSNNWEATTAKCVVGVNLPPAVVSSSNWTWTSSPAEQFMKWGYESQGPGSVLSMRVNTSSSCLTEQTKLDPISLELWYMAYPDKGGQAAVQCQGECSCEPLHLDAHAPNATQGGLTPQLARMQVTRGDDCLVVVEVLESSSATPPSHHFKVGGLLVAEDPLDPTIDNHAAVGLLRLMWPNAEPDLNSLLPGVET